MTRVSIAALALWAAGLAHAHEGHGLALPHFHASDLFGLAALAIGAAGAWWFSRRK